MATVTTVMGGNSGPAVQSSQAGQVTVQKSKIELTAAQVDDATLILRMLKLPAQHRIVSLVMFNDDLDTGAGAAFDIGIADDVGATDDPVLFGAAVAFQTAATVTRFEGEAIWDYAAADNDRFLELAIETVGATSLAGGISVVLTTRPELGAAFEA